MGMAMGSKASLKFLNIQRLLLLLFIGVGYCYCCFAAVFHSNSTSGYTQPKADVARCDRGRVAPCGRHQADESPSWTNERSERGKTWGGVDIVLRDLE